MAWFHITSEKAQSLYGIPAEIADSLDNTFFGKSIDLPYGYDDLRPFLVFMTNKERRDVVTLYIKTIHPESMEDDTGALINPFLLTNGGYLTLDRDDLGDLISIFSSNQKQLPPSHNTNSDVFQRINESNLIGYQLHPEWFPKTKQEYYVQLRDPLADLVTHPNTTIVSFSTTIGFSKVHFAITQFPAREIHNSDFRPFDVGQSRIHLNRIGLQEMVMLLQKQKDYLK